MRIGIFGGSFNPPHKMHKDIAFYLIQNNYLDKVIFVPTGSKYKYKTNLLPNKYRYDMVKLMTDKNPNYEVSDYELKDNVIYTYDTLNYFKNKYKDDIIYFICGTDNLSYIDKWKEGIYLLSNYKFLVINRSTDNIDQILNKFREYKNNIYVVDMKMNELSSTFIREKLKNNDNTVKNYLDSDVYRYILKNNLYKESS